MYKIALFATACTLAAVAAFDPITVVAGTTSYVLTGTQVAVAVASLGALALAAEGLLLAEISRGRGRRAAEEPIMKLDPLFRAGNFPLYFHFSRMGIPKIFWEILENFSRNSNLLYN